jgi:hypothetical protein
MCAHKGLLLNVLICSLLAVGSNSTAGSQEPSAQGPPVPFEDAGACPFEGCVYREWTAKAAVNVRAERRRGAPVSFSLQAGEKVVALTGVVVTLKAGRVEFRQPRTLSTSTKPIRIEPGQTLYLLTYLGEGFTKAWFNGALYPEVDASAFLNALCDSQPDRCAGKVVERSQTEWWVQVRSRSGRLGWTNEPEKFDGKSAIGRHIHPEGPGTALIVEMDPKGVQRLSG